MSWHLRIGDLDAQRRAGIRDVRRVLHERTDGLPLALEETVRLMADRADPACLWRARVRRHLADVAVPPTVRDAVLERCWMSGSGRAGGVAGGGVAG